MEKLKSIFIKYAQLTQKIKDLKNESCELGDCKALRGPLNSPFYDTCIEAAYKSARYDEDGYIDFDEVFSNLSEFSEYGDACEVCVKRRELKKQRVGAQISLGHTRSAITKLGKKFEKDAA